VKRRLIFVPVVLLLCARAFAVEDDGLPAGVEKAVNRGTAFLASQQDLDGSFLSQGARVSTTSRAILAMLGAGHTPDAGRYGDNVRRAVEFLLSEQAADGYFGQTQQRGMRSHALATLALAEAYGVEGNSDRRNRIRIALDKALSVILAAQAVTKSNSGFVGGWNGDRNAADSTLPVTAAELLALCACQDVGLPVPAESLQLAGRFVLRCYDPQTGGFAPAPDGQVQVPSTGAGLLCLHLLGLTAPHPIEVDAAVKYLNTHPIDASRSVGYASTYVVTLCTYEIGGGAWSGAGRAVIQRLTQMQEKDGSWPQPRSGAAPDRTAAAAAALQALTIPYQLLPIYQR
jgi:prenyltransferase beta subunit